MIEYVMNNEVLKYEVFQQLSKYDILGLDIETRGLDPFQDDMLLLQLGWKDDAWVIDARLVDLEPLFAFLLDLNPLLVGHNLRFDLAFLQHKYNFYPKRVYCTMTAFGILENGKQSPYVSLRELVRKHANVVLDKDVRQSFKYTYGDLTEPQIQYAARDVMYLDQIYSAQVKRLKKDNLIRTAKLEFEVLPVTVKMHLNGMGIDQEKWKKLANSLSKEISEVEMRMADLLGDAAVQTSFIGEPKLSINPRSPDQMKKAFAKFGIELEDTRADTLRKLDHPLAKLLLEHREKAKLASTYGLGFLEDVGPDGRIHAEYNPLGTVTGRFSSSGPNMQNIPAQSRYRNCFVADEGNKIITADFSQIELKMAAVLAGEKAMIEEYQKPDADLHQLTADRIETSRSKAKNINFGTLYGISEYGLYRKFDIPKEEGSVLIERFFKAYPAISKFMQREAGKVMSKGFNTTIIGRRRYYKLPPISDPDFGIKLSSIKRQAGNTPIQGSAGEVMKQALVDVDKAISNYDAMLVSTVHDELSVECNENQLAEIIGIVNDKMQSAGEKLVGDEVTWDVGLVYGDFWKKA